MIKIYNKIIRQKQVTREKTRKQTISKYERENQIFLKRNFERKNRLSQILDYKYQKPF